MKLKSLFNNFISIFYPKLCVVCKNPLMENEDFFCMHCLLQLPKTNHHIHSSNAASERLLGKASVKRASAYLFYHKGGIAQKVISEIKYQGNQPLGQWIGTYLAKDMLSSDFFDGIDYIVPVPLHRKKRKIRGFNQAEEIGKGVSLVTSIPMDNENLYRKHANSSQTKKGVFERWQNSQEIFDLIDNKIFSGKHILIIDDVLTTGATVEACVECIRKSDNVKVSFLALAIAQ